MKIFKNIHKIYIYDIPYGAFNQIMSHKCMKVVHIKTM